VLENAVGGPSPPQQLHQQKKAPPPQQQQQQQPPLPPFPSGDGKADRSDASGSAKKKARTAVGRTNGPVATRGQKAAAVAGGMTVEELAEALIELAEEAAEAEAAVGGEGRQGQEGKGVVVAAGKVAELLRLDEVFSQLLHDIQKAPTVTAKHMTAHLVAGALIPVRREVDRLVSAMVGATAAAAAAASESDVGNGGGGSGGGGAGKE
jgi:hypothetical protein